MKIVNKELRERFGGRGLCEYCGLPCSWRSCHHIVSRGAGGPDIAVNLIALGDFFLNECMCHARFHSGEIGSGELLDIVAKREGVKVASIRDVINLIRRLPKKPSKKHIFTAIMELPEASRFLAMRELAEEL